MGDAFLIQNIKQEPELTVIMDGLKLYFDPANSQSYPGSGTTIFDLSTSAWNGTFGNGVTYSNDYGGTMLFPTNGEGTVSLGQQALYRPTNTPFTFQAFVRFTTRSGQRQMLVSRNTSLKGGSPYAWMFGPKDNDGGSGDRIAIYDNTSWKEQPFSGFVLNEWFNLAVVVSGSQATFYIFPFNTAPQIGSPVTYSYNDNINYNANLGGYSGTTSMSGYMGPVLYYDRALTPLELEQNFNIFKERYGL